MSRHKESYIVNNVKVLSVATMPSGTVTTQSHSLPAVRTGVKHTEALVEDAKRVVGVGGVVRGVVALARGETRVEIHRGGTVLGDWPQQKEKAPRLARHAFLIMTGPTDGKITANCRENAFFSVCE